MSVDAKLFVMCDLSLTNEIGNKILNKISEYQRDVLDSFWKKNHNTSEIMNRMIFLYVDGGEESWSNGASLYTGSFGTWAINFKIHDYSHVLWIHNCCSSDYDDVSEGDKLTFSTGVNDRTEDIMNIVKEVVKDYGEVYYTPNDCSEEFKLVEGY